MTCANMSHNLREMQIFQNEQSLPVQNEIHKKKAAVESCKTEMNQFKSSTRDDYLTEMASTQYNTIRFNGKQ